MFSFLFVDCFNLLELILWCVATAVCLLSTLEYFLQKEKKKNKELKNALLSKMKSVKSLPDETEDDLEMLDLSNLDGKA